MLSVLDIFRVGIGPSSSHTVGPMRITERFIRRLQRMKLFEKTERIEVALRGSLAFTGEGHGSPRAALLGLAGLKPESFKADIAAKVWSEALENNTLKLGGKRDIAFNYKADIRLDYDTPADLHPNEMAVMAYDATGGLLEKRTYYSTGGGFIASKAQLKKPAKNDIVKIGVSEGPYQFKSAADLLNFCRAEGLPIHEIILANEDSKRPRDKTKAMLDDIAEKMMDCINRGLETHGILPGGLKVTRRAPRLWDRLQNAPMSNEREQLFDWLNVYAMAVNEENAAGGQVVTAPTNGAAGIIPSVIRHYCMDKSPAAVRTFLLTAGGIGLLYKQRASISGAEMGCQGEVGVACSMAAGGLAAVWGGTPDQVCSAAEIGMEHNLGLTCDPVGGLVQIPCIERNAIGAVKAVNAARLALHSSEAAKVSLDQVIETMRQTGLDMSTKYKETSQGGLAVNVVEC
ncbi:L-serine dehydratase [Litorimonas taeanensis]|uniref:L-serine dehydratase n=1 Tax=Litorimonas taeanensis TaxID=568099 RepID=A0A420WDX8_9PROT|nr:L-serine ammonia-lyase [Litorimonas taeanensis]RKQ69188.1 L-serine dehydratase [Litorimonas taeanensis]